MKKLLSLLFIFIGLGFAFAQSDRTELPMATLAPILDEAMPAVVNIAVQGEIPIRPYPIPEDEEYEDRRDFDEFSDESRKFESMGSGVIVDASQGYILTNDHVIRHAKTITVTLNDGRRVKAKLIGADIQTDLAVIKIEANNITALPIGNSDELRVGDFVVAIGNPFGLNNLGNSQTATFGIVSALQRSDLYIDGVESFIQTDAAINPGNSGGALIDAKGQLMGINTAIITPHVGNVGIGFAIPVNMALDVMGQLIEFGSIQRGLMGIFVQHLTPELAEAFGASGIKGALVTQVNPSSPAEKAGLKSGDIIQSINGAPITTANQVRNTVSLLRIGSNVQMNIIRNGKKMQLNAVVADLREHEEQLAKRHPFLFGLALRDYAEQSPLHGYVQGVQITGASEASAGWRAGLRPTDVIIDVNGQAVRNINDLEQIANRSKERLLVHILRGPGSLYLVVQ